MVARSAAFGAGRWARQATLSACAEVLEQPGTSYNRQRRWGDGRTFAALEILLGSLKSRRYPEEGTVTDTSSALSRRTLLAGLAASPALTAAPVAAQTPAPKTAAEQALAALKDAKATKLVLLGTGAGPGGPGPRAYPENDFTRDAEQWRGLCARLRARRH
jgi:hypothetical protein